MTEIDDIRRQFAEWEIRRHTNQYRAGDMLVLLAVTIGFAAVMVLS